MTNKVTDSNFDEFIADGVKLVDFWAEWCQPCKMLGPILEDLSEDYENIGKLNVDENPEVSSKVGIRNIPTILVYKDGEVVDKHVGMAQREQLEKLITKHSNS